MPPGPASPHRRPDRGVPLPGHEAFDTSALAGEVECQASVFDRHRDRRTTRDHLVGSQLPVKIGTAQGPLSATSPLSAPCSSERPSTSARYGAKATSSTCRRPSSAPSPSGSSMPRVSAKRPASPWSSRSRASARVGVASKRSARRLSGSSQGIAASVFAGDRQLAVELAFGIPVLTAIAPPEGGLALGLASHAPARWQPVGEHVHGNIAQRQGCLALCRGKTRTLGQTGPATLFADQTERR